MSLDRVAGSESFAEAFERELDKGIVVDSWGRLRPGGIHLVNVESHSHVRPLEIVLTLRS